MPRLSQKPALIPAAALLTALSACADLPPLDATVDAAAQAAPYPDLLPTEQLSLGIPEPRITDDSTAALESRGARLRRKADALRARSLD